MNWRILTTGALTATMLAGALAASASANPPILTPTDDAYIKMAVPDTNYGSSQTLTLRNRYGHPSHPEYWEVDALIRFEISEIPPCSRITRATLHLYYYEWDDNNPAGRELSCYRITSAWDEETVTWNTQPTHSALDVVQAVVPAAPGVWMSWDLTEHVRDMVANPCAEQYGWIIMDEKPWGAFNIPIIRFRSSEYGQFAPHLEIEYACDEDLNADGVVDVLDLLQLLAAWGPCP